MTSEDRVVSLVHREAFFFDEISERFLNTQNLPKTLITKEHYTAMSHYVTLGDGAPRGGQMRDLSKGTERSVR